MLAQQWFVIVVTIVFSTSLNYWWLYVVAIVVIAAKQHALAVIVHDATHYRVFDSRFSNEYFGNLFCAFPIFISIEGYRGEHQLHHLWTNTYKDPYRLMFDEYTGWQWPKTNVEALLQVLSDIFGLNILRNLKTIRRWSPIRQFMMHYMSEKLGRRVSIDVLYYLSFWATIFSILTIFGAWRIFLLLWIVPLLTFYVLFTRLRWISEHPYVCSSCVDFKTRHVEGTILERFFIAPLNVNYHLAHHLFPSVPLYNLPIVHSRLLQIPAYREEAELYSTYLGSTESIRAELVTN
jgi:fatty acid desaturase